MSLSKPKSFGGQIPQSLKAKCAVDIETGCWNWTGYKDSSGYGRVNMGGEHFAHRYVYQVMVGLIPDGMDLDHLCSNRSCVNPAHLEPVPEIINIRRSRVAKLTMPLADEIRELVAAPGGLKYRDVAAIYGISHQAVGHIARHETWSRVA